MSSVYEFPKLDQRYDEASVWIAKLDNNLSAEGQKELQEWLAADQENQAALFEMAKLWDKMTVLSRLSDLFPKAATHEVKSPRIPLAMATSVLVAVFVGFWASITFDLGNAPDTGQDNSAMTSDTVYETAIGEQSTVKLVDGTQVVLNTNSRIEVNYTDGYRLLRLERGEIHVQVAHDSTRPLGVIIGERIVRAVGTAFTLKITSEQSIELLVTEGMVLVGVSPSPDVAMADVSPEILKPSSVTLAAGEEIVLGSADEKIMKISLEEIEVKLSWRKGNLIFRGESLEEAVAEISRYTTVQFVILDDELKIVRIAGLFRTGDVDGLLATLRENFNITHHRDSAGKIMLASAVD